MRVALAFLRASFLVASGSKLSILLAYGSAVLGVLPLFFIAGALQPIMGASIRDQGGQYFGFLLVGFSTFLIVPVAVTALPRAVGSAIGNGTLEAVLTTSTPLWSVLLGMISYEFVFVLVRILLLLLTGAILGAPLQWAQLPAAALVLALTVASYLPFGVLGAALMVRLRTVGPAPTALLAVSSLLGGVYYPTHVIPSWLEHLSAVIPLTYGLRALRRVLLEGWSLASVGGDLLVLAATTLALLAIGGRVFTASLDWARRDGSLGTT